MNRKEGKKALCAICGKNPATTLDHIPPKGVFSKPRPNDLIKVPACFECNNEASKFDELFRVYLSLHVGVDNPATKSLWKDQALRTLTHNRKLLSKLQSTQRTGEVRSSGGIIVGKRQVLPWNSEAHKSLVERMVRGLYYHHFKGILGDKVTCKTQWLKNISKEIYEMSKEWKDHSIGGDRLIYRYVRSEDKPLCSIWVFQFYGRHFASGYTEPKD